MSFCNSTIVNFTNLANDAQVKRTTVYEYFEILKDTLILHELPAWDKPKKRKPIVSSKYYFLDIGLARILQNRTFTPGSPEFGEALETFFMHELMAYRDYKIAEPLHYWRSLSGFEVDFILGDHTAIEVKAKNNITSQDLKSLAILSEKKFETLRVCIPRKKRRRIKNIEIIPYKNFLQELWSGTYR